GPSTPGPTIAAVSAFVASIALPQMIRLRLAATAPMTNLGASSLNPYWLCRVSRDATMNPATTTNSTKTPFAATSMVVQRAFTWPLPVSAGVDSTVAPRASTTGVRPVAATHSRNSFIACRTCPGMSNSPGPPPPSSGDGTYGAGGVQPGGGGPGVGDGVPGG